MFELAAIVRIFMPGYSLRADSLESPSAPRASALLRLLSYSGYCVSRMEGCRSQKILLCSRTYGAESSSSVLATPWAMPPFDGNVGGLSWQCPVYRLLALGNPDCERLVRTVFCVAAASSLEGLVNNRRPGRAPHLPRRGASVLLTTSPLQLTTTR